MHLVFDGSADTTLADPAGFGRVAVLAGGSSAEREVSLAGAEAVLAALRRLGVDAQAFDPAVRPLAELPRLGVARAFIMLHGPGGEDGALQGALEHLGIPYTGSGVAGCATVMDKLRTKRLAAAVGIATADYLVLEGPEDLQPALERLGLPLMVKPATQGSSVGMSKVERAADLPAAFAAAAEIDTRVFAESWIGGHQYTVGLLKGRALPAVRVQTPRPFLDYEAKHLDADTRRLCPCGLSSAAESHLAQLALAACAVTGAEGWASADFVADATGRPLLLEINAVPGMTGRSLLPAAAGAAGLDFGALVWEVLSTSLCRSPRELA
ncbi:MAG TPA: D-alanine--D-alanine ligase [Steroidobacteraceae bacterium]|nr:D-alanine--D-alanine ligase [Steroidobacteraceae bacterium]